MSAQAYQEAARQCAGGGLLWLTGEFRAVLVSGEYVPNFAAHTSLAAVAPAARLATSPVPLTGKTSTISGGVAVLDADDMPFGAITTVLPIVGAVLYRVGATEATSPLVAYITGSPFPFVGDSGPVTIKWDALGVLRIG